MKFTTCFFISFAFMFGYASDPVQIEPLYPQPGQSVTIRFDPQNGINSIPDTASAVTLVFTYSNFYELPWRIPMNKKGKIWETSFIIPSYGVYATFYLEGGGVRQLPSPKKHYAVEVHKNGRRVVNGFLYESYSLSAQLGRDSALLSKQRELLEKELEVNPSNYEAGLRLIHNKMQKSNAEEKEALRKKGLDIIAAKFYEQPGVMGNMNKVTMGYLIIGENSRLDSIRNVIKTKYPKTEAGYSLIASDVRDIEDEEKRKLKAESIIKNASGKDQSYLEPFHRMLMEYYAKRSHAKNTLLHYRQIVPNNTPYKPEKFYEAARFFTDHNILLPVALQLADSVYQNAHTYPAGLIRHFPETGYLPAFVDAETRKRVTAKAQANSLSLKAVILKKMGKDSEAEAMAARSLQFLQDEETLSDVSWVYRNLGKHALAYEYSFQRAWMNADDTTAFREMKMDYSAWKRDSAGWKNEELKLRNHWQEVMTAELKKVRINSKAPEIERLVDIKGNPVAPGQMLGKIIVIDFWATWCVPCMQEMPYLQNIYDRYKNNDKVQLMIINTGSKNTLQDAQGWSGNKKYSFPVYYTNDIRLGEKFGFNVIPATYVIATDGYIQFKTIGFEGPAIERKLAAAIDLLLKEQ